jgi:hypothetical protein
MSKSQNQQPLTPEQIEEYKRTSLEFYRDRIEFMKVQLEYEKLNADVEEAKLRSLIATLKYAQITSPMDEEEETNTTKETKE